MQDTMRLSRQTRDGGYDRRDQPAGELFGENFS